MDSVEEIKDRLSVDEVVGSYIQLKTAGRNRKGLCPFHHEKTPSFMVNPEKGIWHCFGCGEGGDIFSFVMKMEGIEFKEALNKLAQQAGVEVQLTKPTKSHDRLYEILELATRYYQLCLSKTQTAQKYLKARELRKATLESFRVGYALNNPSALGSFLKKKGFSEGDIQKTGLAKKTAKGSLDFFRGRIMLPFIDSSGRTIGFTARVIINKQLGPKYLNSPASPIYDKSRFIFGLYQAREAIRQSGEAVVVEGNLDVLSSHQAGTKQVVAVSGTALTQYQLKQLGRLSSKVKLAFDADKAGLAATKRAITLAQGSNTSLYIIDLPAGKDPDELIKQNPKSWQRAIAKAEYAVDWFLQVLVEQYDAKTVEGKKRINAEMISILKNLSDSVEQDHYVRRLSQVLDVSQQAIRRHITPPSTVDQRAAHQVTPTKKQESDVVEEALLTVAVGYPDTRVSLQDISADHFTTEERKQVYHWLRAESEQNLLATIQNYIKILEFKAEEQYAHWAAFDRRIEAFSLAQRLQALHIKKLKQSLVEQIKHAEGDKAKQQALLAQFQQLLGK